MYPLILEKVTFNSFCEAIETRTDYLWLTVNDLKLLLILLCLFNFFGTI